MTSSSILPNPRIEIGSKGAVDKAVEQKICKHGREANSLHNAIHDSSFAAYPPVERLPNQLCHKMTPAC